MYFPLNLKTLLRACSEEVQRRLCCGYQCEDFEKLNFCLKTLKGVRRNYSKQFSYHQHKEEAFNIVLAVETLFDGDCNLVHASDKDYC